MSVAHCCTWLHDWSTLRLHALFALIIAGHVAFIWAGDVYNVSSNTNNLELQTKVRGDFTMTEEAPIRALSWLKVPMLNRR